MLREAFGRVDTKEVWRTMKIEDLPLVQKAALLSGASEWDSRGNDSAGISSFVMSDGPHGVRRQLGSGDHLGLGESVPATCFPTASILANSWDPELAEEMGKALGEEARELGVNVLLGPGLNIKRDPLCGRNFEYFSEDPIVTGRMGAGLIRGIQSVGVSACPKHFAVNSQETRRQASNSVVDERTMRELYLTAFEIAVREASPWSIMTSYNMINGVYAHENSHLLQDILRQEWGFDGMVVSDWGGSNSATAAVRAGGSLEMPSPGYTSVHELVKSVQSGRLDESHLDQRVHEVAGLAARTTIPQRSEGTQLETHTAQAHHMLAGKVAERSFVLLKNQARNEHSATLPLTSDNRIALIGDFAKNPRFQGTGSSKVNPAVEENLLEECSKSSDIALSGYAQGYTRQGISSPELIQQAVDLLSAESSDMAVVVVGLDERHESEGLDRSTMSLPQAQNDLLAALAQVCKPIIVVLVSGSPVELPWADEVDALLYVGLSGQASASAIVKVLSGAVNPAGHLAESWPIQYADCPTSDWYPSSQRDAIYQEGPFVGYRYYHSADIPVRFPFGFGLSYSHFSFSDFAADEQGVHFTVHNDSDVDGSCVAQLYVQSAENGVLHPKRELKGFVRIPLRAHEQVQARIDFDRYTFRHFDCKDHEWHIETGRRQLLLAQHSNDIGLQTDIDIDGDVRPAPANAELGAYLLGQVKDVNDAEIAALFGQPVRRAAAPTVFTVNDPIASWQDSPSFLVRAVIKFLQRNERNAREKTGAPDLNALFVLNMPPRVMCKMTRGQIDSAMVDAVVRIANGHLVGGLTAFVTGYFRNRTACSKIAKELSHE
jgi:beta-glucosidase